MDDRTRCAVWGCSRPAEISIRFGGQAGERRYCAPCGAAAETQIAQPKLVIPDWYTVTGLASIDRGPIVVICRACGDRRTYADADRFPARCVTCGSHGRSCSS